MRLEGDYSDVLTYLAQLFGKKRLKKVEIAGYEIEYDSCTLLAHPGSNSKTTREFPPSDEIDRVSSLVLLCKIIKGGGPVLVTITWDFYSFVPDIPAETAEKFISMIDTSTFRYF